jgi:hypothetical protein
MDYIMRIARESDPLLSDIILTLDWNYHVNERGKKPWIDCRDRNGNLYTVTPEYDHYGNIMKNVYVVHRFNPCLKILQ